MSHHCRATVLVCEDFRLHQRVDGRNYISDFIKSLSGDCDIITRGGGVLDIVRPAESGFRESVVRDLKVSTELHQVKEIYLINHEDCGAYGSMNFSSKDEELKQHFRDLKKAKKIIGEEFKQIKIKIFFAELVIDSFDKFVFKEVA